MLSRFWRVYAPPVNCYKISRFSRRGTMSSPRADFARRAVRVLFCPGPSSTCKLRAVWGPGGRRGPWVCFCPRIEFLSARPAKILLLRELGGERGLFSAVCEFVFLFRRSLWNRGRWCSFGSALRCLSLGEIRCFLHRHLRSLSSISSFQYSSLADYFIVYSIILLFC